MPANLTCTLVGIEARVVPPSVETYAVREAVVFVSAMSAMSATFETRTGVALTVMSKAIGFAVIEAPCR